jgi:hypothetical protein
LSKLQFNKGGDILQINKTKFHEEIFSKNFDGNYSKCAKALNVAPQQLHSFLNHENSKAGPKLLGGLFVYCEIQGLNFKEYIILHNDSTAVYRPTGTNG